MEREWGNGERKRKWREIHCLHFLIFSFFPPSLSIFFIKNCLILSQNVKFGTFVTNVTQNLTRAMRKQFWVEFAARKLRKLWGPAQHIYLITFFFFENLFHILLAKTADFYVFFFICSIRGAVTALLLLATLNEKVYLMEQSSFRRTKKYWTAMCYMSVWWRIKGPWVLTSK